MNNWYEILHGGSQPETQVEAHACKDCGTVVDKTWDKGPGDKDCKCDGRGKVTVAMISDEYRANYARVFGHE